MLREELHQREIRPSGWSDDHQKSGMCKCTKTWNVTLFARPITMLEKASMHWSIEMNPTALVSEMQGGGCTLCKQNLTCAFVENSCYTPKGK